MAKDKDDKNNPLYLRSPRQATRIFGLDQDKFIGTPGGSTNGPPRPKFLFVVRFLRGAGGGSPRWRDGLSFAVRKFDRPRIEPQVQTMNQYNKKRLVQTGVKYSPINIDFYDTVDGVVSYMWHEYVSYYYGDFRRGNQNDWRYDLTTPDFYNSWGRGFGLELPQGVSDTDLEASAFFEKVECYQFFGGQYTQVDLVRPKITSFSPDGMDYEDNTAHGINMALDYEAVIYHNNYVPSDVASNKDLLELYGPYLDGDVYEPPSAYPPNKYGGMKKGLDLFNQAQGLATRFGLVDPSKNRSILSPAVNTALSSFGNFNFSSYAGNVASPITGPLAAAMSLNADEPTSQVGTRSSQPQTNDPNEDV
jgi:hypothetical protein